MSTLEEYTKMKAQHKARKDPLVCPQVLLLLIFAGYEGVSSVKSED